ncbi:MAG: response regulator [Muricomes sp.]|uniref:response regulator transcription factor n=1 Tax=Faecalicatena contorta TaxID=39482 RepID=UPI002EA0C2BF|nr:response regulator [Muricomes sp.]
MLRVAIIDDEFYFRQYLKTCIDWAAVGCELVGEAADGEIGLALIEEKKPDIVLLDINMPCMDGLECSRIISEKKLETIVIILSGYSEFEYARKAMKYNVRRYLLKPLDEKELGQVLEEAGKEIQVQKNYRVKMTGLEEEARKTRSLLEEKMIDRLIHGIVQEQDMVPEFLKCSTFAVLILEIVDIQEKGWSVQDERLWKYAVKNVTAEAMSADFITCFSEKGRGRILCLLGSKNSSGNLAEKAKTNAEKIAEFVSENLPFIIDAGLGKIVGEAEEVGKSYEQACFSLRNKYHNNGSRVTDYEDVKASVTQNNLFNSDLRKQMILNLRQGEQEAERELIHKIFNTARSMHLSYDMLQCHCMEFLFICMEYLEEISVPLEKVWPSMESPLLELESIHKLEEAEARMLELYEDVFSYTAEFRSSGGIKKIEEIKEYIAEHYYKPEFKISDISQAFFLNYHYLCYSFKKQTGMTLNQYITFYRIEKAKQMIEEGCCNITLLSEKVGYSDMGYFGKCFKKQIGISPSKYMEMVKHD